MTSMTELCPKLVRTDGMSLKWNRRLAVDGNPRRLCGIYSRDGGWQFPAALRHVPPGTRTVLGPCPQAADLHWAAHSTSPIVNLRSSAIRRCDNYHGIVELDGLRTFLGRGCIPRAIARP
jgi:hypothetical protein